MVNFLLKNILSFHEQLDASEGIRDLGAIEAAVNAPFQTFGGQELCPTVYDKAARLGYGLCQNHGFIDGNKRVALHAMELFLKLHVILFDCSQQDRINIMMRVAKGELTAEQLKIWLMATTKIMNKLFVFGTITIKNA